MKFLLLLVVVVTVLWLIRGGKRRGRRSNPPPSPPPASEAIVACRQCGLHLPRSDALVAAGEVFCSEAHRAAFERAQP